MATRSLELTIVSIAIMKNIMVSHIMWYHTLCHIILVLNLLQESMFKKQIFVSSDCTRTQSRLGQWLSPQAVRGSPLRK